MKSIYMTTSIKKVGNLMINISESHLRGVVEDVKLGFDGRFLILGSNKNIVLDTSNLNSIESMSSKPYLLKILQEPEGNFTDTIDGKTYLINFARVDRTGWKVVGLIPLSNITDDLNKTGMQMIIMLFACLLIGSLLGSLISIRTSRLLETLVTNRFKDMSLKRSEMEDFN